MKKLFLIAFILLITLTTKAYADGGQFGGYFNNGNWCAAPAVAVTVGQFNLSTSKFAGGISPGIGYGLTYKPQEWYGVGLAAYLAFSVGGGVPNQAIPSLLFSFANYVRFGFGISVTEQDVGPAKTEYKLLFGLGIDFGGSSNYIKEAKGNSP